VLLPGLISVSIMFQGIAAVAMPLSVEFGAAGEIYDRVMSPLPVSGVAIEKVVFSALQSAIAAMIVFPLVILIPSTPVHFAVSSWPLLVVMVALASLASGAMGLVIGTAIQPQQIGLIFGVVVVPVTFLGCVYYPWFLLHHVRWLQYLVLINPIVYMSEGLRAALTPEIPHMPVWAVLLALTVSVAAMGGLGVKGFLRRVVS
jgi:ABC-2 type transport system permease protein